MIDRPIPVVDLFAGPGGLGEGFSSCMNGSQQPAFKVRLSIEMDPDAHTTLELRSFFRQFLPGRAPTDYYDRLRGIITTEELFARHPRQAKAAHAEAWLAELGKIPEKELNDRIKHAIAGESEWVLCGGPPCQAYSTVGRSRQGGIRLGDNRVYLYREYLRILAAHEPSLFIMENVKGLLSSRVAGRSLFNQILSDLEVPGAAVGNIASKARYRVVSIAHGPRHFDSTGDPQFKPEDFVVRSELFGVPQCRHRVILLGLREDLWGCAVPVLRPEDFEVTTSQLLQGLPKLRSGLSRTTDSPEAWNAALHELISSEALPVLPDGSGQDLRTAIAQSLNRVRKYRADRGGEFVAADTTVGYRSDWFLDPRIGGAVNHASRSHMTSDLHRYLYAAAFAKVVGRSPELREFPSSLLPDHRNVTEKGKELYFDDRFRVQVSNRPSTTITCHIAKDGHYYIHYDPAQCRSLTVREVARLQTFPDNYLFCGPRTAQYRQVGNAVPPLLANRIARAVARILKPGQALAA